MVTLYLVLALCVIREGTVQGEGSTSVECHLLPLKDRTPEYRWRGLMGPVRTYFGKIYQLFWGHRQEFWWKVQICTQKAWERFSSPNKNLELDTFGHQASPPIFGGPIQTVWLKFTFQDRYFIRLPFRLRYFSYFYRLFLCHSFRIRQYYCFVHLADTCTSYTYSRFFYTFLYT